MNKLLLILCLTLLAGCDRITQRDDTYRVTMAYSSPTPNSSDYIVKYCYESFTDREINSQPCTLAKVHSWSFGNYKCDLTGQLYLDVIPQKGFKCVVKIKKLVS